ncbi:MAG: fibronectin type III-like domain-contianing protein [Rhizobiaceae bacterium]
MQIYVGDDDASVERPEKELKAFEKVALAAGERAQVSFSLDARAFAFYSVEAGKWLVEPGDFTIRAGLSSADLPEEAKVSRETTLKLPV